MKITADAKALSAAIVWGSKGASRAANAPVNATAVIGKVSGTTLTLFSFDGNAYFSADVTISRDLGDDSDVTFRVYGPQLATSANLIKDGRAVLTITDKNVNIAAGRSKFNFAQIAAKLTPPPGLPPVVGTVNISDLRAAASHAAGVASADETVPSLTAVLAEFNPKDARLVFEATDRYRMVIRGITYAPVADAEKISVLAKATEFKRILSDIPSDGDVELHASEDSSFVGLSGSGFSGYVNRLDVPPVPYQRMLEQPFPNRVVVNRNDFKAAVASVVAMTAAGDRLLLNITGSEITVTNSSQSAETTVEYVSVPDLEEDSYEIGYHAGYLNGALSTAKSEDISLSFSHPSIKPTIFHEMSATGQDDPEYNHIVMPLR